MLRQSSVKNFISFKFSGFAYDTSNTIIRKRNFIDYLVSKIRKLQQDKMLKRVIFEGYNSSSLAEDIHIYYHNIFCITKSSTEIEIFENIKSVYCKLSNYVFLLFLIEICNKIIVPCCLSLHMYNNDERPGMITIHFGSGIRGYPDTFIYPDKFFILDDREESPIGEQINFVNGVFKMY